MRRERAVVCFNYGVRKSSNGNFVIPLLTSNSTLLRGKQGFKEERGGTDRTFRMIE